MDFSLFYKIPFTYWTQSYWRDEAFRILLAKYSLLDIVRLTSNDGQPPLYYFVLKIWMFLFGDSEVATRTLSLIFFELLIFAAWKFFKTTSKKNALKGILLFIVNPALIYFAFEARMYMMFILLVFVSFGFLWLKKYYYWIAFSLLGLYTNNFMVFVIPFQIIWLFLQKVNIKFIINYTLLLIIGYLPWFFVFLNQMVLVKNDFWVGPVNSGTLINSFSGIFFSYEFDPLKLKYIFFLLSILIAPFILFTDKTKFAFYNKIMFWGPLVTILLVSVSVRSIFLPRYLSFLIPIMIILIIQTLSLLPGKIGHIIFLVIVAVNLYVSSLLYPYRIKTDIRSAVIYILDSYQQGDVIYASALNYFETKYYFAKFAPKSYTDKDQIKIYSGTGTLPFYVGKVLIKDEAIVSKIIPNQRIFTVDQRAKVTINSRN